MKHIVKQFFQRDANPYVQFVKYGICGGVATFVDILVFYTLAFNFIPALTNSDPIVTHLHLQVGAIPEATRSNHFVIDTVLAFLFSNTTAYILNALWVFTPGRHQRHIEIALFYIVSIISIATGTFIGWVMIKYFGLSTSFSYVSKCVAALMINYVCRKFVIFKG